MDSCLCGLQMQQEAYRIHFALGERLYTLDRRYYLLSYQFLDFKCTKKRTKYHVNKPSDDPIYKDLLLFGKKGGTNSFDTFPCTFKEALDSVLYRDSGKTLWVWSHDGAKHAYYGVGKRVTDEQIKEGLEQDGMVLCAASTLTPSDIRVLIRLNQDLLAFMDEALEMVEQRLGQSYYSLPSMRAFRNKMARIIAKYN